MKLRDDEKIRKQRGDLAKSFIDSDFYKKYFYPELERMVSIDFPEPGKKGWEDEYRRAWATAKVVKHVVEMLNGWSSEAKALLAKQKDTEKDFIEA